MPYPSVTFTEILSASTRQELEQFVALLQGYLSQEHNEAGEHTHINALSLVVEDTASIEDDLDVGNGSVVISEAGGDAPAGSGGAGPGIRLNADPASATPGAWDLFVDTVRVDNLSRGGLLFRHAQRDRSLAYFRYDSDAGSEVYCFAPHDDIKETGGGQLNLGSNQDGSDQGWFNKAYIEDLYLLNNGTTPAGKWTTFSPTWTNVTVGNGTVVARFTRIAKTVHFFIHLTLGGTSSVTGSVIVSTPATMNNTSGATRVADCSFFDVSAGQQYWGGATVNGATAIALFDNASPNANVGVANPFGWASGDILYVSGSFEEA